MGLSGGAKAPSLPEVKSVGQLTTEATQANISNLPAIIEAFNKYGPEAASSMLTSAQALNPTLKPLGDLLNKRIDEVSGGGIPDTLRASYEREFRNSMASRGFLDSPVSANEESIGLANLGETYAQNTITGAEGYGKLLPNNPTLSDLGLTPPSIESGVRAGEDQNLNAINIAYQQQVDEAARKKKQAAGTGALIGGGIGGIVGLAGGPFGAIAGAQAGSSIGGTFF